MMYLYKLFSQIMRNKVWLLIPGVAPDKIAHFCAGVIIASTIALFNPLYAILTVVLIAIGKEWMDMLTLRGCMDYKDAVATITGGIIGCLLVVFLKLLV